MVNVFIWVMFLLFALIIVASAVSSFMTPVADLDNDECTAERVVSEQEVPMLRKWFADLVSGRALSEKDRNEVKASLAHIKAGRSYIGMARWMVYLLEHCPSANWHAISFYVKRSHESLNELRSRKTGSEVAKNVSTCFAECDSLLYIMRKNELLVETV